MSDTVILERDGSIAWITLNRPQALNAINEDVRVALPRCIREADSDPDIRVIVVRGTGPKAFSAGADIKEFVPVDSPVEYRQSRTHESWIRAFDEARKPLVASIHGFCLGGGLEIALACDLRIAASDATFGLPETGLGIMTGVGGSQRLPRLVGLGIALDMIITGQRIDGKRAHAIGLVSRLCEPDALAASTRELANTIATKAPLAVTFAKEAVRNALDMELSAGLRNEIGLLSLLLNTDDRLEAARAFREKRTPVFLGR